MADKLTFVRSKSGEVDGFQTAAEAQAYARESGGSLLSGKEAAHHQLKFEADSPTGAATAFASNTLFGAPKLAVAAFGPRELQEYVAAANEANPWYGAAGSFVAPWGAAGRLAGAAGRGLAGLGEAGSVFGKTASVFGEGSSLAEQAAARGAGELAAGEAAGKAAMPLSRELGTMARPGFGQEASALAGRAMTPEAAAIAEAHPGSFLQAAVREGSLNAGVGALNSAGDYMLSEKYMDGNPKDDAQGLAAAILHGAVTGGVLGGAAGAATHGAGKTIDALLNPLSENAPKVRVPEAMRAELETSLRNGGMSAAEAKSVAQKAIEHGIAGTGNDVASYNAASSFLENARIKRGLERGEFQLPPSMSGEAGLKSFVDDVAERSHIARKGGELPSTSEAIRPVQEDITKVADERRASLIAEAKKAPSPEAAKVWIQNPYKGELSAAASEAEALGGDKAAALLEKADKLLEKNPTSRTARIVAMDLMDQAMGHAPPGFHLEGERSVLSVPLEHEANGPKFLSALGEHQLADKARRDIGNLMVQATTPGAALSHDAVVSLEQATKQLGLEGGRLDTALREHYVNEAARAVGAESKELSPVMKMLGGLAAGGIASKVLGSFTGGFFGRQMGQTLMQAAADPIAASATIRKATTMLNYGAKDLDRLINGLAPTVGPKASLVNLAENLTPYGKLLWDTKPGQTARAVGEALENGFKALAPSMPQRAAAGMQVAASIEKHLSENEPKPVQPEGVNAAVQANLPPRYNPREVAQYQGRLQAVVNPKGVIANFFATGELTKEAADTLRVAHPLLVQQIIAKGSAQIAQAPEADRYGMARQLEMLAGPKGGYFSPSSTPAFTAAVQKSYAQAAPAGPGPGGPSGNASPQGAPTQGGTQYAPVSVTRNFNGDFLKQTMAAPSAALSTSMGAK